MNKSEQHHPDRFAVKVAVTGLPAPLFYLISDQDEAQIGDEALVELGKRTTKGWVIDKLPLEQALAELSLNKQIAQTPTSIRIANSPVQLSWFASPTHEPLTDAGTKLKPVIKAVPTFLPEQLVLFEWMANYYGTSLCEILDNAVPKRAEGRKTSFVQATEELRACLQNIPDFLTSLKKRAPIQAKIVNYLSQTTGLIATTSLLEQCGATNAVLTTLKRKNLVEIIEKNCYQGRAIYHQAKIDISSASFFSAPSSLTEAQRNALTHLSEAMSRKQFSPFLLYGVTGSGKTEVYLRAISQVLAAGGSALVIVPEIALTPQFIDHFCWRLEAPIALLHSQVGDSARWEAWEALRRGEVNVGLGARSAVFAPLRNLSLIIVDEEHESSYKQSDSLRYHARDVAVMRGKFCNATVILGSATPSFESLLNVQKKRYRFLELPERATSKPVPTIEIVDLNQIKRREMASENISPQLLSAMKETLDSKGQVIILYNRRGFANYLQCPSCNEVVMCPNCSVPLTLHQRQNRLLCHYCDLQMISPRYCSFCRDSKTTRIEDENSTKLAQQAEERTLLVQRGAGTERIVEELNQLFPAAQIERMDRDATRRKSAYREILTDMRSGKTDILVGTQMIAKGHDLPGVTLVGIINADIGLHIPDFRSAEKSYQLIVQAAGRAGRGTELGRVIVQTRNPKHPTIVAALSGRFMAFARYELDYRTKLDYPPISRLMRLIISSSDPQDACQAAELVRSTTAEFLAQTSVANTKVLGPAPAPLEKLCSRYRWHILVKSQSPKQLSQLAAALNSWKQGVKQFKDFRLAVDIDPVDMM